MYFFGYFSNDLVLISVSFDWEFHLDADCFRCFLHALHIKNQLHYWSCFGFYLATVLYFDFKIKQPPPFNVKFVR